MNTKGFIKLKGVNCLVTVSRRTIVLIDQKIENNHYHQEHCCNESLDFEPSFLHQKAQRTSNGCTDQPKDKKIGKREPIIHKIVLKHYFQAVKWYEKI